jgi:hypothetical protein
MGIAMNWVDLPVPEAQPGIITRYAPLVWVKKHCATYITNDAVQKNGEYYYRFYFGLSEQGERDRAWFALRWS